MNASSNLLKKFNPTQNTRLQTILVSGNQLTSVDVSQNLLLSVLRVANNPITALSVINNQDLQDLDIRNSAIATVDLRQKQICTLDARGAKVTLIVDDARTSRLDWQSTIDGDVRIVGKPPKVTKSAAAFGCINPPL